MLQYNPSQYLPTAEELPETDHKPVDSQLQMLMANLLEEILAWHWRDRPDWFWGINLGVYYDPQKSAIVPDGFLSLGVERLPRAGGRLSYVVWQENGVVPLLVVEYVSKAYGDEYGEKKDDYANIGVSYYVVYNPEYYKRGKHKQLEVYHLVDGQYVLQESEPVWIPEVGLGIGRGEGTYRAWTREWLYWYDQNGNRLSVPTEVIKQEYQRAEQEYQRAEQEYQRAEQERQLREELLARLKERGIDIDTL